MLGGRAGDDCDVIVTVVFIVVVAIVIVSSSASSVGVRRRPRPWLSRDEPFARPRLLALFPQGQSTDTAFRGPCKKPRCSATALVRRVPPCGCAATLCRRGAALPRNLAIASRLLPIRETVVCEKQNGSTPAVSQLVFWLQLTI